MANKINSDDCTNCGACESECPNGAITSGDISYVIDPAKCDECASKGGDPACRTACPVECITQA